MLLCGCCILNTQLDLHADAELGVWEPFEQVLILKRIRAELLLQMERAERMHAGEHAGNEHERQRLEALAGSCAKELSKLQKEARRLGDELQREKAKKKAGGEGGGMPAWLDETVVLERLAALRLAALSAQVAHSCGRLFRDHAGARVKVPHSLVSVLVPAFDATICAGVQRVGRPCTTAAAAKSS
jgi:hypothetical protein